ELTLVIAVGGTWPRERLMAEVQEENEPLRMCPRSYADGTTRAETPLHLCWTCPHNKGKRAFQDSDTLVPEAVAQYEQCPAFWFRGLTPSAWTSTLPPARDERWEFDDNKTCSPGALGVGTQSEPIRICGDASGGLNTMKPAQRRVGVALVTVASQHPFRAGVTGKMGLTGRRLTAFRRELAALEAAIFLTSGRLVYITDNLGVAE
ncbi:unnamed protein product, partial [Prorocentrum cordatum]